jgi:hypothetical protein
MATIVKEDDVEDVNDDNISMEMNKQVPHHIIYNYLDQI